MVAILPPTLVSGIIEPLQISALESLQSIEINQNNIKLTEAEERLVRIFTIRCGGVMSSVTSLGGGLSGVRVIKLLVTDRYGAKIHNAVAKLGTPEDIRDEAYRVQMYVSRLNESSTPRQLDKIEFGAGKNAGVFYSLADPYESTAYASALKGGEMATLTVRGIASAISNWNRQIPQRPVSVTEIRQRTLSDEKFFELVEKYELQWILPIEQATVQVCWGCTHGDLHGFNALVAEDGRSVVIDYGDVAEGPVSFDPVTLELSLLFHPGMNETVNSEWPSLTQAEKWGNVELFLDGCPVPDFIRECRDWALDIGAGQREISASAYSYLMRQLKYPDTDKERILALLKGVKNNYDNTM
ncbi:hypothetical protein, partial [uncultured Marinobacter sp.]|uniref:hypothetical protein n=1 Tax=uncultured Marinobacter sp. TaxID=187379 RepID=UPI0025862C83